MVRWLAGKVEPRPDVDAWFPATNQGAQALNEATDVPRQLLRSVERKPAAGALESLLDSALAGQPMTSSEEPSLMS